MFGITCIIFRDQTIGRMFGHPPVRTPLDKMVLHNLKYRHSLDVAHTIMICMNVPKYLLGEVVLVVVYLINQMSSKALNFKPPLGVFERVFFFFNYSFVF